MQNTHKYRPVVLLEMHLNGQLLDAVSISGFLLQGNDGAYLSKLKSELKKKHQNLLSTAESRPAFILSGVQSCINSFVPLTHFGA